MYEIAACFCAEAYFCTEKGGNFVQIFASTQFLCIFLIRTDFSTLLSNEAYGCHGESVTPKNDCKNRKILRLRSIPDFPNQIVREIF